MLEGRRISRHARCIVLTRLASLPPPSSTYRNYYARDKKSHESFALIQLLAVKNSNPAREETFLDRSLIEDNVIDDIDDTKTRTFRRIEIIPFHEEGEGRKSFNVFVFTPHNGILQHFYLYETRENNNITRFSILIEYG